MRSNTTFRGHTFVARSALLLGVLAPTALHAETAQHAETELRAESGKQANAATRASSVDAPQLQPSAAGVPQAEELQAQPPPAQTPPAQQQPPAQQAPAQAQPPAQQPPAQQAPAQQAPAEAQPPAQAPADQAPAEGQAPAGQQPAGEPGQAAPPAGEQTPGAEGTEAPIPPEVTVDQGAQGTVDAGGAVGPIGAVDGEFDASVWEEEAQAAAGPVELGDEEAITVTVDRRERDIQDYAGSAEAFSAADLERTGVVSVRELSAATPYVEIGNQEGNLQVYMRGVGTDYGTELGDPAAATHLDGIYVARPRGVGSMFFDIERVEINRGPQGTLRGRNATAGSLNIISKAPELEAWDAEASLQLGSYSQKLAKGMVNIPLGDTVALRFAAFTENRDPFYTNAGPVDTLRAPEDADTLAYRMSGKWQPTDNVSIVIRHDYTQENGTGVNGSNFSPALEAGLLPEEVPDPRAINLRNPQGYSRLKNYGFSGNILVDFGPVNMEILSGFRAMRFRQNNAGNAGVAFPGQIQEDVDFDNWSRSYWHTESDSTVQELRFFAPEGSAINWTAGGFFFNEEQYAFLGSVNDKSDAYAGNEFNMPDVHSDALGAYADATFDIVDALRGTLGLRFTSENKSRTGIGHVYGFGGTGAFRHGTDGFQFATTGRTDFTVGDDAAMPPFSDFTDGIARPGVRDTLLEALEQDGVSQWGGNMNEQKGDYSDSFVDFRVGLDYDLAPENLLYAMFSTAHKSGGFNDNFTLPDGESIAPEFGPEVIYATEIGSKNVFLDRALTANLSAFWYAYTDQQFQETVTLVGSEMLGDDEDAPSAAVRFNAADSRILGLEADLIARLPAGFTGKVSAMLLDAKFVEGVVADYRLGWEVDEQLPFDLEGNTLPKAPTFAINYGIEQMIPTEVGYFDWLIRAQTKTKQYMTIFNGEGADGDGNANPYLSDVVPATTRLDAAIGFTPMNGQLRLDAFVSNLTDTTFMTALINTPQLNLRFFNPPRQFGVRLSTYL